MDLPLVSIIITSFNRGKIISEAIDSALNQNYENLEIIISDNCSTDNTDEIIKGYLPDTRIRYFKNDTNIGMIPNFQMATLYAKGDYITYVSSDDYLINENFISEAIRLINSYPNILLVFAKNQTLIDNKKQILDDPTHHLFQQEFKTGTEVFLEFANSKTLGWGGTVMKRSRILELNIFSSTSSSLDYEANLLLMLQGNVGFIAKPTYVYRIHGNQVSQNHLKNADNFFQNHSYIHQPYKYALEHKILSEEKLEKWKSDLLLLEATSVSLRFLPRHKAEYDKLMDHLKLNHNNVYKRLKQNLKWKFLSLLYKNYRLGIKIFRIISKGNYDNLKNILSLPPQN